MRGDFRGKIPGLFLHLIISILILQLILSPYLASAQEIGPLPPIQVTQAESGSLDIEVNVRGAVVTIDQQKKGKAPLRNIILSPGVHKVVVSKKGYESWSEDLVIEPGTHQSIVAVLRESGQMEQRPSSPAEETQVTPSPAATAPEAEKQKVDLALSTGQPEAPQKPIYKRWWFWTLVVLAAGGAAAAAGGGGGGGGGTSTTTSPTTGTITITGPGP